MKTRKLVAWVLLGTLLMVNFSIVSSGCSAPASAPPSSSSKAVEWKAVSVFPVSDRLNDIYKGFIEAVNQRLAGKLQITLVGGPEVIKMPAMWKAGRDGTVDMIFIPSDFAYGEVPKLSFTEAGALYGMSKGEEGNKYFWDTARTKKARELSMQVANEYGLEYLGTHLNAGTFSLLMKRKAATLEDFKGMKARSSGGKHEHRVLNALGISAVPIAPDEVYDALRTGVIDANVRHPRAIETYKEYEVAPYYAQPPLVVLVAITSVNKASWDKLPPDVQSEVHKIGWEFEDKAAEYDTSELKAAQDRLTSKGNLTLVQMDPASEKLLRAQQGDSYEKYLTEDIKDPEFAKKVREIYEQ